MISVEGMLVMKGTVVDLARKPQKWLNLCVVCGNVVKYLHDGFKII